MRTSVLLSHRVLVMLFLIIAVPVAMRTQSSVTAQEPAPAAPAAAAPAPAAAPAAAPPAGAAAGTETAKTKSFYMWVLESSGVIGAFIAVLFIYFVALIVRLFLELRPDELIPPLLVEGCEQKIEVKDFQGVYDLAAADPSYLGTVLTVGIAELSNGYQEAREVMERTGEAQTAQLEKKIGMLAVLGTLGPMIGLLGTLKGMIASFSTIALHDTQLKASEVAGGISEALILTFEGVALSVPAIYFFAVFRSRVSVLSIETMLKADEILRSFAHAARNKGAVPAAQPAARTGKV